VTEFSAVPAYNPIQENKNSIFLAGSTLATRGAVTPARPAG